MAMDSSMNPRIHIPTITAFIDGLRYQGYLWVIQGGPKKKPKSDWGQQKKTKDSGFFLDQIVQTHFFEGKLARKNR